MEIDRYIKCVGSKMGGSRLKLMDEELSENDGS